MNIEKTNLPGVLIVNTNKYKDNRGFFLETYHQERYLDHNIPGINLKFVQDNHSFSYKNVLRGMHFQLEKPQGKLVRVLRGEVFDVAVDIRKKSPTFGNWEGVILSDKNKRQLWVPPGFAHGLLVLSNFADFEYKCTDYYDPNDEGCLLWNDPDLGINWPLNDPILSFKDRNANKLIDL